jgi:hypothetical protein
VVLRTGQAELSDLAPFGQGGRPPAYFEASESNPSSLKLWTTARPRSQR